MNRLNQDFRELLDGWDSLGLAMMRSSAQIIHRGKLLGYLNDNLDIIREPQVVWRNIGGRDFGGRVPGFLAGTVTCRRDLEEEVDFWRSDHPMMLAQSIGIAPANCEVLLSWFEGECVKAKGVR